MYKPFQAAQPKPYDFTSAATGLGALGGLGLGTAYHGGMVGGTEAGVYGLLSAPFDCCVSIRGGGASF